MATILIIDDEVAITQTFAAWFERGGHTVLQAHTGNDGVELTRRHRPDLVLLDVRLPDVTGFEVLERVRELGTVVLMITGHGDVAMAVQAMKEGAENFLTKPVDMQHLSVVVERAFEKVQLRRLSQYLGERRHQSSRALLGASVAMRDVVEQVDLLAQSDRTTVLILGESGTGKARVAELIHRQGPRSSKPYVEVNCAALNPGTLDADLFGREYGASTTSPEAKAGLLEVANGGTIFLDEIGDLDASLQPKLLRVLEGKGFRRQGGTSEITVDVRLIAATAKDLVNEVTAGAFREDLYYRLSVMPINLPPLRARSREDLVSLVGSILDDLKTSLPESPPTLTEAALEHLLRYSWPGNIRELRNALERAMILARGRETMTADQLPAEVREATGAGVDHHVPKTIAEVERAHIERTLRAHGANRTHAARELGISRATLIKKIREYGLSTRIGRERLVGPGLVR